MGSPSIPVPVGTRFGKWVTITEPWSEIDGDRYRRFVMVRCECGQEARRILDGLRQARKAGNGQCFACGQRAAGQSRLKYGDVRAKDDYLYRLWCGVKKRCCSESGRDYPNYGGRGITMLTEWVNDYAAFAAWISANLGVRPEGCSLDRIDNDGNYEPGNLRWATRGEQNKNRRPVRRNAEFIDLQARIAELEAENAGLRRLVA